jgi:hypothetical protein
MYKSAKKGWYTLVNTHKFIKPHDGYMKSFNESTNQVEFKSSLEMKSFRFCDTSSNVKKWSCEPFHIKYLSPKDNKFHRYYIDLFVEFNDGKKFIVEVKSSGETSAPKVPKKITKKSEANYRKAVQTWLINSAKWKAAESFAQDKGIKFIFLTEKELK